MIQYFKSKALDKQIKFDTETGVTTVADLKKFGNKGYVQYSIDEIEILRDAGTEITPEIHLVKNVFDGTIIRRSPSNGN